MNIQLVEEGDIIVEGKAKIAVRRVERNACSKKGVHINDNACYDNTAHVVVIQGERELPSDVVEETHDEGNFDADWDLVDNHYMTIAYENSLKAWADRVIRV